MKVDPVHLNGPDMMTGKKKEDSDSQITFQPFGLKFCKTKSPEKFRAGANAANAANVAHRRPET